MAAKMTYEDGIRELESIVTAMEKGEMSLEESFKAFEKGIKLSEKLKKILTDGDARIRELTAAGDRPFDGEEI